jgi:hypothetical protein
VPSHGCDPQCRTDTSTFGTEPVKGRAEQRIQSSFSQVYIILIFPRINLLSTLKVGFADCVKVYYESDLILSPKIFYPFGIQIWEGCAIDLIPGVGRSSSHDRSGALSRLSFCLHIDRIQEISHSLPCPTVQWPVALDGGVFHEQFGQNGQPTHEELRNPPVQR